METIFASFQDERLRSLHEQGYPPPPRAAPKQHRGQTHPLVLLAVGLFATTTLWLSHSSLSASDDAADAATQQQQQQQQQQPVPPTTATADVAPPRAATALSAAASTAAPAVAASAAVSLPPYSPRADCKREYDRPERGGTLVRCGTTERSSCCRSFDGVGCYYTVADATLCERAAAAAAERGGNDDGNDDGGGADGAVGAVADGGGGGDEGGDVDPLGVDASVAAGATEAASTPDEPRRGALPPELAARAIVPMVVVEEGSRVRGRLAPYPRFNLTWTRGAPTPTARTAGWSPTEAQRRSLPERDLKEAFYRTCAVVGSSGNMRRSGYGWFIDQHQLIIRFNGAPAGGGFSADVGSRTTHVLLADVVTTDCVEGKSRQSYATALAPGDSPMDGKLLRETAMSWRPVKGCNFYPGAAEAHTLLFLPKRGGVERLVEYAIEHPERRVMIRSEQFAEQVDSQIAQYRADSSHPTSGFNGVNLALHMCETLDIYGFGTQREKYFSPPRPEKEGSQHLYRSEYRWLLGLEHRFPGRVRVWP